MATSPLFLSIDVGSSQVRTALCDEMGRLQHVVAAATPPSVPAPGLVEYDAAELAEAVLSCAKKSIEGEVSLAGVGIATQRATALVWDKRTGVPVAPAIGWQDLRTVFDCLALQAQDLWLAPNMSATKIAAILNSVDEARTNQHLLVGTLDSYLTWVLTGGPDGGHHVSDGSNAAVTGLVAKGEQGNWDEWDETTLSTLRIARTQLPRIVDSVGPIAPAKALSGSPMITALLGDQQSSLIGQGCTRPGMAKATFGTGGVLDLLSDGESPDAARASAGGTFPIVAWRKGTKSTFGTEAIMLSAGAAVTWLVDDLGVIDTPAQSTQLAASVASSNGAWFVPALMGLGTPVFDFGARGTLLGISAGIGRGEIVRAVLEGVAERGADLLEAAQSDSGFNVERLCIDGGMSENAVFVHALADACQRPIAVSQEREATIIGAGMAACVGVGVIEQLETVATIIEPGKIVSPTMDDDTYKARRLRWYEMREKAERTIPELSGIVF